MNEKIKNLIAKSVEDGKSAQEIAAALSVDVENELNAKEAVKVVRDELKRLAEVEAAEKAIKALEEDEKLEEKVAAAVEKVVKDELKSLKADPASERQKAVKIFDKVAGKCVEYKAMSEDKKAMADMLFFSRKGDNASLDSLQKDIAAQVSQDYKTAGIKAPLYTDATTGSYLIPTEVATEILAITYQLSQMYQRSNRNNVVYNDKVYPVMADMEFAFIADESTQIGDKTPTITNPSIAMKRYGGLALLSNTLIQMRSPEVVNAIIQQAANANAQFIDLYSAVGSVTTDADPFNGLVFDANTAGVSDKTLATIKDTDFIDLIDALSFKLDDITFISNRKVRQKYGLVETTGGERVFKDFMSNGNISPMGYDFIENRRIPSTLTVNSSSGNTSRRTGGTSDVLIAADLSKFAIGIDDLRIDMSEHFKFDYDQTAWRFVGRIGSKMITSSSDAGAAAAVIELTN